MQIAVRFGREAGFDRFDFLLRKIALYDLFDKVFRFRHGNFLSTVFRYYSTVTVKKILFTPSLLKFMFFHRLPKYRTQAKIRRGTPLYKNPTLPRFRFLNLPQNIL